MIRTTYLLGVAMTLAGGTALANHTRPVCDRSPLAAIVFEQEAKTTCDKISEVDLSRMDYFQIGFDPKLKDLKAGDTAGLSAARFLYLNCNPNLVSVPADLTVGLDGLEVLAIHTNPKLRTLPGGIFRNLSQSVRTIMMMNNGLTSLPDSFFQRFAGEKGVDFYLSGNPFTPETLDRIVKTFNVQLDEKAQLPHRIVL